MSNNENTLGKGQLIAPALSLFTSVGTLLCCALPALFVTLGMGAALAGFIAQVPWITAISDYKVSLFALSGILILSSALLQWRARYSPCPADPAKARACTLLRKISWVILGLSAIIYAIGFFFAFLAADFFFGS